MDRRFAAAPINLLDSHRRTLPAEHPATGPFGLGTHFCVGALARLEARIALTRFAERIESPRLNADPAAYRDSISLRGPERLEILNRDLIASQRRWFPWSALSTHTKEKRRLTLEDVGRRFRRSDAVSGI